jgi:2-oxoisovalerate dehydrogenase E1 component beta subunit
MATPVLNQTTDAAAKATRTVTLGKSLNLGLRAAMEADPKVIVMGEDVGKLGGVFRITDGLQKDCTSAARARSRCRW